jgi:hypothetical protein
VLFGGGGRPGAGAEGAAAGAEVDPPSPQLPHFGHTHSTVHWRTGTSLTHGHFISFFTSQTLHLPQHSWQPLFEVSPPVAQPPEPAQLSQHFEQRHEGHNRHLSSQQQVYLYSVTFFVVQ